MTAAGVQRAPVPYEPPPDGHEWVAREARPEWRVCAQTGYVPKLCSRQRCREQGIAQLNRGRRDPRTGATSPAWWTYCLDHAYGRWVENGRVMQWHLEPIADS